MPPVGSAQRTQSLGQMADWHGLMFPVFVVGLVRTSQLRSEGFTGQVKRVWEQREYKRQSVLGAEFPCREQSSDDTALLSVRYRT